MIGSAAHEVLARTAGGLLGRDEEISRTTEALETSRLVTLTGAPGIGKTRLALAVAGAHRDRSVVVELAAVTDVALVSAALASALSLEEMPGQSPIETGAKTSGPTVIDPGGYNVTGGLSGVACPSANLCAAVANYGDIVMFDPTTGNVIHGPISPDPYGFTGVACPSTTLCAAVDYVASEVTFNPTTSVATGRTPIDPDPYQDTLLGVACPSTTQCSTLNGFTGTETTVDPNTPGSAHPTVDIGGGGGSLIAVACPSTTQCTAVLDGSAGGGPQQVTFNPTLASNAVTSGPTTIAATGFPSSVTCPSTSDCVATDSAGNAVEGDPGSSSIWTVEPVAGASYLYAVACSSVAQCVTVDQLGNAFVGITAPLGASAPAISGQAVVGQTLTEAHGSWSPAPTGFSYQWSVATALRPPAWRYRAPVARATRCSRATSVRGSVCWGPRSTPRARAPRSALR